MAVDEFTNAELMFNSQPFDCSPLSKSYQKVGFMDSSESAHLNGDEHIASDVGSCSSGIGLRDDDLPSPPCKEAKERESHVCPCDSFKLLREYRSRRLKLDTGSSTTCYVMQQQPDDAAKGAMLSTESIIKLAAQKFISLASLSHPTLPSEEEVQLVQNLLYCAEKVGEYQYERAVRFLKVCDTMSSPTGTPIQRLVFYFSQALLEKIANETGRIIPKDSSDSTVIDPLELVMLPNMPLYIAFHKEHPLAQLTKLVGVEAILDHLEGAKKVHIIDLEIRSGVQWIVLMQALALHPIEHLKITIIGTKRKAMIKETGIELANFAKSLHLKFSFKAVLVDDILDLDPTLFDREGDEFVSIYANYALMSMLGRVDRLNHLMMVMRSLNPCVMIVTEIEANCNSPNFIGRFVESLFFFGAFLDSMADCFKNDESSRANAESTWFRSSIRNVLTTEGEQRKIRHVNMNVWRAFFARHGLVETELSVSSLEQAKLGLQSFPRGSSCTLYVDDKCLILGWKGTPLLSLSAWKFQ